MTKDELTARWIVELDGRAVAILTDPQLFEMFWVSLNLQTLTDDASERLRISTDRGWWLNSKLTLRNRPSDVATDEVFPAGDVFTDTGRVILREILLP
ncbi:MAG: hypothetical protein HYX68_23915 [Planctomycetes bacterium]|nr:hypothetical protein [Planctomycetota bacterium]